MVWRWVVLACLFSNGQVFAAESSTASRATLSTTSAETNSTATTTTTSSKKDLTYLVSVGGSTRSFYRGALMTEGSFSPGVALKYKSITFAGTNFMYGLMFEAIGMNLGFSYFNDHLISNKQDEFRRQRPETWEALADVTYSFENKISLLAGVAQDLRAHKGQYLKFGTQIPLGWGFKVGYLVGVASQSASEFTYGTVGTKGWAHDNVSLGYSKPGLLPWRGLLNLEAANHRILQDENRKGLYVKENDETLSASISGLWMI